VKAGKYLDSRHIKVTTHHDRQGHMLKLKGGLIVVRGRHGHRVHAGLVDELLWREGEPANRLGRAVEGELTAQRLVLKRGGRRVKKMRQQQAGRCREELGTHVVLVVPLQLHPSVLKPGLHL